VSFGLNFWKPSGAGPCLISNVACSTTTETSGWAKVPRPAWADTERASTHTSSKNRELYVGFLAALVSSCPMEHPRDRSDMSSLSSGPAAFSISGACAYSGFTRTFLYENKKRLDWFKAGRRSLITRASLDALIAALPRVNQPQPPTPIGEAPTPKPSASRAASRNRNRTRRGP
jgi:hypothetical protein